MAFFSDLVDQGVISQDQADQLLAEIETRAEARQAERAERRVAFEAAFSDDVLTVAELEELEADRILAHDSPFADALADGELTRDEWEAVRADFSGKHHRGRRGAAEAEGTAPNTDA